MGKKEKVVSKIKLEMEDRTDELNTKTIQFRSEDSSLKVRFDNLKQAQTDLNKCIKP
jgi:hypothetical protein